jgi:hypothetical protein
VVRSFNVSDVQFRLPQEALQPAIQQLEEWKIDAPHLDRYRYPNLRMVTVTGCDWM